MTVRAPQIVSVHDGKMLVDPGTLPEAVRSALRKAHDSETR